MATFQGVGSFSPADFETEIRALQQVYDNKVKLFNSAAERAQQAILQASAQAHQASLQGNFQQAAAKRQLQALKFEAAQRGIKFNDELETFEPDLSSVEERTRQANLKVLENQLDLDKLLGPERVRLAGLQGDALTGQIAEQGERLKALPRELSLSGDAGELDVELRRLKLAEEKGLIPERQRAASTQNELLQRQIIEQDLRLGALPKQLSLSESFGEIDLRLRDLQLEDAGIRSAALPRDIDTRQREEAARADEAEVRSGFTAEATQATIDSQRSLQKLHESTAKLQGAQASSRVGEEEIDDLIEQNVSLLGPLIQEGTFTNSEVREAAQDVLRGRKLTDAPATGTDVIKALQARKDLQQYSKNKDEAEVLQGSQRTRDEDGEIIPSPIEVELDSLALKSPSKFDRYNRGEKKGLKELIFGADFERIDEVIVSALEVSKDQRGIVLKQISRAVGPQIVDRIATSENREKAGFFEGLKNLYVDAYTDAPPPILFDRSKKAAGRIIKTLGLEEQFRVLVNPEVHGDYGITSER